MGFADICDEFGGGWTKEQILICIHAGVIRCFWDYVMEIPLSKFFKIPVEYGSVTAHRMEREPDYNAILRFGDVEASD